MKFYTEDEMRALRQQIEAHAQACRDALDRFHVRPPLPEQLADLTRANLTGANLTRADLTRADLTDANLTSSNLENALFDGPARDRQPRTIAEAAEATKVWLTEARWLQNCWIETPDGAYSGSCKACLHGAAVYVGGPQGPALSAALTEAGYTVEWNDKDGRRLSEVAAALDEIAAADRAKMP